MHIVKSFSNRLQFTIYAPPRALEHWANLQCDLALHLRSNIVDINSELLLPRALIKFFFETV